MVYKCINKDLNLAIKQYVKIKIKTLLNKKNEERKSECSVYKNYDYGLEEEGTIHFFYLR